MAAADALAVVSDSPMRQRFAWRTTVTSTGEGSGARHQPQMMRFSATEESWEATNRALERPVRDLLFARAIVVGDGATERAFLPPVLRDALGPLAHGISVVDSVGMERGLVGAVIKFARHIDVPLVIFADDDSAGRRQVGHFVASQQLGPAGLSRCGDWSRYCAGVW